MNQKTTVTLIVALAVAVLGLWWAQSTSELKVPKEAPGPKALFDPPLGETTEFEVVSAGGSAPLKFVQTDGKWRMTAPINGPCDLAAVSGDVTKIRDLKYVHAYSKGDRDRPDEQQSSLASPLKSIKFTSKDGKSESIRIGAVQALSSRTYVQKEGDDTIYLVESDLNTELKRGLAEYRGKRLAEYPQSDIVRVEMSGDDNFILVKGDKGWTIESPVKCRADAATVNNVLREITNLTAIAFVEDSPKSLRPYGLEPPRLNVTVTTEKKTPKPAPAPPTTAPAQPEFDVTTEVFKYSFGATAEDKVFARMEQPAIPSVVQVMESLVKGFTPDIDALRDKTLADVQVPKAQKVVYSTGGEKVELVKDGILWRIAPAAAGGESKAAEFAAVADLLKALSDLKAVGFESAESPEQGFAAPRATIEVFEEGQVEPMQLAIGGTTPSKTGTYVKNLRTGTVSVVKSDSLDALVLPPGAFLSREMLQFDRERAVGLSLFRDGAETRIEMENGEWKFTAPIKALAESAAIGAILVDLANLRGRKVVGTAADAAKFGLDKPEVRVGITVQSPPPPAMPPSSQAASQPAPPAPPPPVTYSVLATRKDGKAYMMTQGGATICEVDAKVLDDLDKELLDTRVAANIEPSQARKLVVDSGETVFAFEKDGDIWKLLGEETFAVDPAKITELVTTLKDLRAKSYAIYANASPPMFGLDKPSLTLTVETDQGPTALMISSKGPVSGERYANISTTPGRVFVLKAEDLPKLTKAVKDFQKQG